MDKTGCAISILYAQIKKAYPGKKGRP